MPLAFPSQSHGTIAFGFFNIECDMLLLAPQRSAEGGVLFFFADRFCQAVVTLAAGTREVSVDGYRIADPRQVGNVNAAIQGYDLSGFIGATYKQFPFPTLPEAFKQQPDGAKNRPAFETLMKDYGAPESISFRRADTPARVSIAEFVFSEAQFAALIGYVDRGGYPRWKDEVRPAYVKEMMEKLTPT